MTRLVLVALFGIGLAAFAAAGETVPRLQPEPAQTGSSAGNQRTPDVVLPVKTGGSASTRSPQPRVLLLYANDRLLPANLRFDAGFREALGQAFGERYELFTEFLDAVRFPGDARDEAMASSLRVRYQESPPQVLVAAGPEALSFFQKRRDTLFPGTPLVFGGMGMHEEPLSKIEPDVAGVPMNLDLAATLSLALRLRPQTREVVVVFGSSKGDRAWESLVREQFRPFESRVKIALWKDGTFAELTKRAGQLPPEAAMLFLSYLQEPDGTPLPSSARALELIAAKCSAPIFGPYDTYIGKGIVGGVMTDFAGEGAAVARLVQRILAGEKAREIGVQPPRPGIAQVDARQLDRWQISPRLLPAASVIHFRERSLWETHRHAVLAALVTIAILTVLVLVLLATRRRARETDVNLSMAADAARIGLWQRRPGSGEITASPRWREIFGFSPKAPLTLAEVLARVHPEDQAGLLEVMEKAARDGQPYAVEHRLVHPDGTVRWIASYGRSDPVHNGRGHGTRGASMDITQQREAADTAASQRRELAHLSRVSSLGVLSGSLAHELNQPLAIILSNAQAAEFLLESDHPDLDQLREVIGDIVMEDRRAGDVIKRLRALLRHGETAPQSLDVSESVREVMRLTQSDLIARNITAKLQLESGLPCVLVDRVQLQQVLLNLILNACDAMAANEAPGRILLVETSAVEDGVRIAVRDRGHGLADDVEKLFQPFHTTKEHGLGMGLTICRTLIHAHGGRFWAEANPDCGATFFVAFPAVSAAA